MTELERVPGGRRRVVLTAAVVVLVVAAIVGVSVAAYSGKSPRQAAADARPPEPSTLTASVERRQLSETVVLRGTVRPGNAVSVSLTAGGESAPVVTALPKKLGDPVNEGDVVVELSGRPVIALVSSAPLYRDILPGSEGADVRAVQEALGRLGFSPSVNSTFDARTQQAVKALYERLGYAKSDTGKESFATLRQLKAEADDARTALSAAEGALREKRVVDPADTSVEADAVTEAKRRLTDAQTAHDEAARETGVVMPRAEVVAAPALPGFVSTVTGGLGSELSDGTSPIELSTGGLVVESAAVMPAQAALLKPDQQVTFDDETGGFQGAGKVLSVGPAGPAGGGGAGPPTEDGAPTTAAPSASPGGGVAVLRVVPDTAISADMNGRNVRITVSTASTVQPVIAVPISAVTDTAEGKAQIVLWPSRKRMEIETGLVAGGWVEVRSPALDVGAKVRLG
jgi:hypothetical protein